MDSGTRPRTDLRLVRQLHSWNRVLLNPEVAAHGVVCPWPPCGVLLVIGAGRAAEGLRTDWQDQLATVQTEIGFHYLRMHGLLCYVRQVGMNDS